MTGLLVGNLSRDEWALVGHQSADVWALGGNNSTDGNLLKIPYEKRSSSKFPARNKRTMSVIV